MDDQALSGHIMMILSYEEKRAIATRAMFLQETVDEVDFINQLARSNNIARTMIGYKPKIRDLIMSATIYRKDVERCEKPPKENDVVQAIRESTGMMIKNNIDRIMVTAPRQVWQPVEIKSDVMVCVVPIQHTTMISYNEIVKEYFVSPKIDGVSYLLRISKKEAVLQDKNGSLTPVVIDYERNAQLYDDSIFLVEAMVNSMVILDVAKLHGVDVTKTPFEARIKLLPEILFVRTIEIVKGNDSRKKGEVDDSIKRLKAIRNESQYSSWMVVLRKQVYTKVAELTLYDLSKWNDSVVDGLCFFSKDAPYGYLMAWKPSASLTVDFRVRRIPFKRQLAILELSLMDGNSDYVIATTTESPDNRIKVEFGSIWECLFDGEWRLVRLRKDKSNPNTTKAFQNYRRLQYLNEDAVGLKVVLTGFADVKVPWVHNVPMKQELMSHNVVNSMSEYRDDLQKYVFTQNYHHARLAHPVRERKKRKKAQVAAAEIHDEADDEADNEIDVDALFNPVGSEFADGNEG